MEGGFGREKREGRAGEGARQWCVGVIAVKIGDAWMEGSAGVGGYG